MSFSFEEKCDTIVLRKGVENMETCKLDGCDKPVHVKLRGLCYNHAVVYYRNNSPIKRTCSFELCERKYYAGGLCQKHYERKRRTGTVGPDPIPENTLKCTYEKCSKNRHAKGLCKSHYQQHWLGMPLAPVNPRGLQTNTHKECMDCRVVKPHSEFYKEKKKTPEQNGLKSYCKSCFIERVNKRNARKRAEAAGVQNV